MLLFRDIGISIRVYFWAKHLPDHAISLIRFSPFGHLATIAAFTLAQSVGQEDRKAIAYVCAICR